MRFLLLVALLPSLVLAQAAPRPSSVLPSGVSAQPLTAPGFFPSAQDFIFYADPAGSDSNDCASVSTPCQTLQAALAKVPPQWSQKARVILAAGTYTFTGASTIRVGTPVGQGEPLVIQGAMEDSGLGERTITAVGTYGSGYVVSVTDDTLTPTLDQWEGYFIRMTTCAAGADCVGMTRIVRGNSTGGLFEFNCGSTSTTIKPAVGDKFVIEKPASIISYNSILNIRSTGTRPTDLILHKVQLLGTTTSSGVNVDKATIYANTVSLISSSVSGMTVLAGSGLYGGDKTGLTADELIGSNKLRGSGLYLKTSTPNSATGLAAQESTISGWFVTRNAKVWGIIKSYLSFYSPSIKYGKLEAESGAMVNVAAYPYGPIGKIANSNAYGFQLLSSVSNTFSLIDISSNGANGIALLGASYLYPTNVTGTGNTGAGILVQDGSTLAEGAGNTVTGTLGDVLVGGQVITHAAIGAGGSLSVPPAGSAFLYPSTTPGSSTLGSVKIGSSGTSISSSVRCTGTLDTNTIDACVAAVSDCYVTQLLTCTGAAVGGECSIGSPSTLEAGLVQGCAVASANSVAVRTVNATKASITPAGSQTVTVRIWNP